MDKMLNEKPINMGILGCSEIAFRRFLPALEKTEGATFSGVASRDMKKTEAFTSAFGGRGYGSYEALLEDDSIDAVYLPLPPGLHFQWGKKVIESGKHLLMEKPFTASAKETAELLDLAEKHKVAVHENYMFFYHSQLKFMKDKVDSGEIGELRLLRSMFSFPRRDPSDIRYNKDLAGGSLLDCGGYPIALASYFLGDGMEKTEKMKVLSSSLRSVDDFQVDIHGSVTLSNDKVDAQIAFGMDNHYQCSLELYGSKGAIKTDRIFTAPSDFSPRIFLEKAMVRSEFKIPPEDTFLLSLEDFIQSIHQEARRGAVCQKIAWQSQLVEQVKEWRP